MKRHLPCASALLLCYFLLTALHTKAQTQVFIPAPTGHPATYYRYVNGLATDAANNLWAGYRYAGLAKYDGFAWTVYDSLNSPLPNNKILSVAAGASGVWAGTNAGLFFFNGTTWTNYNTGNSNIGTDSITTLYAKGNEAWFYSNSGFTWFNGSTFQQFNTGNSPLVSNTINCLMKDAAGILWIGTAGGISSFNGSTWQSFTASNSALPENDIRSLAEDANHNLYVGTHTKGLYVKQGSNYIDINTPCGYNLTEPSVEHLFTVSDGTVLLMNYPNTFYSAFPVSSVERRSLSGWSYEDTTYFFVNDNADRLYRVKKSSTNNAIYRFDSIMTAPAPPGLSPGHAMLDVNEVSTPIWCDNTYFWDAHTLNNSALYEVPKGCGRTAVFAHALWFGGLDNGNNLHVSAQTYRQMGDDWWPGPLDSLCSTDSATVAQYDTVWKVNRDTINNFIYQFNLGNVTNGNYPVPAEIANWPTHGTGLFNHPLAPYIDVNGDGVYNPMDGDYPDMKGDQMLWWVMNDSYRAHTESSGLPLGLEVQCEAYAWNCSGLPDSMKSINFTTFYSYKIISCNSYAINNTYVGMWTDVDLGNSTDDYVGCRIDGDYGFAYNGDNYDESVQGYGYNPPMTSIVVLKGPDPDPGDGIDNNHNGVTDEPSETCMMNNFMYYNNDASGMGNPSGAPDYYKYLRSLWLDNSHLRYGGIGTGFGCGATSNPWDYAFSGIPYDTGWTEASACIAPGDRRFVMSSGPFTLYPGSIKTLDYAIVFSWDNVDTNSATTSVAKNHHDVMQIKH